MSERHVFRFFVDVDGEVNTRVELSEVDRRHGEVLRLADGDMVEVVDASRVVWDGAWFDGHVDLLVRHAGGTEPDRLELFAGSLTGGKFDVLVDSAVQAGVTSITPVVTSRRDAHRLIERRNRLERIAQAAARQSKRTLVPQVHEPISVAELPAGGIVVDPGAPETLDAAVRAFVDAGSSPLRLLVGGSEGLDPLLVTRLVDDGWQRGRLGPTILRSELAAPVAVAIAAMLAPRA